MHGKQITSEQKASLHSFWNGELEFDAPMAKYSTLKSGGPAAVMLTVTTEKELVQVLNWTYNSELPFRIIGGGSNILVNENGFHGVVICLKGEFCEIIPDQLVDTESSKVTLTVGAGCSLARLVSWCVTNKLAGLEFLTGIPGTLGGAVRMNAGAFNKSMSEVIESLGCADDNGTISTHAGSEFKFSYRNIEFKEKNIPSPLIVRATLTLRKGNKKNIQSLCANIIKKRKEKQPYTMPSAGSFFKNPVGDSAGRLIEAAGLKGLQYGDAMVSDKHANFIVNTGSASATDITSLMKEVQIQVYKSSGIMLEPEVHFI